MKFLSTMLIIIGSIGIVFQSIVAFNGEATKHVGYAIGFTVLFLLPGILLYIKTAKKNTIDNKTKSQHFVCPNGCNVAQQGTNYCGLCGTRLVRK